MRTLPASSRGLRPNGSVGLVDDDLSVTFGGFLRVLSSFSSRTHFDATRVESSAAISFPPRNAAAFALRLLVCG
jgi:hypothetical protein